MMEQTALFETETIPRETEATMTALPLAAAEVPILSAF